jgi:hypothetical protein
MRGLLSRCQLCVTGSSLALTHASEPTGLALLVLPILALWRTRGTAQMA